MVNNRPLALVTGASSGIGAAFARRLTREGYRLILVARRRDRLEALAKELGNAEILVADLAGDAGVHCVEERILAASELDLLVNNAGFGTMGAFFEVPVDGQHLMHHLHVLATMRLTHAALRGMVPRRKGGIINVSSVAGFGQSPDSISYCATKAWINSFTEGLYMELKLAGSPVKVQALCPGFTHTEFQDVIEMDRKLVPGPFWLNAEDVVAQSLAGLAAGKLFVIPGAAYKTIVVMARWTPRWMRVWAARRYWRKKKV